MADNAERTEAPTPRRRTEARSRGQIARSHDLTSALLLTGGLLCMRWFAPQMMASLMRSMRENLTFLQPDDSAKLEVGRIVATVAMTVLTAAGPIMLGLLVMAVVANVLPVGWLLTGHPLQPTLNKLNPINGVKRLFSTRVLMQMVMNLLKLTVVSAVAYSAISSRLDEIVLAIGVGGWHQVVVLSRVLYDVGLQLALVLFVVALLDYIWQRYKHERDLRMTKEEIKEEMRRMEGDPIVKSRRRKMQFAAAMQRIRRAVPKADVIVTNPTELAIAIQYDAEKMTAPTVVAKGKGLLAQKIREIAIQHGVPIVERKALAQALFKAVEVGQQVPEEFYQAIAEILAYVYELSGRSLRRRRRPRAA